VPTGIEETLAAAAAAIGSAVTAGAATSPLAGVQDPAGSGIDASNAAALGVEAVIPSGDALDGDPSVLAAPGSADIPISGDRPPPAGMVVYEFAPAEIHVVRRPPAPDPADTPGDHPTAARPAEPPAAPPPHDTGGFVPTPPGQVIPQPPGLRDDSEAPPAGEREPAAPEDTPPTAPDQDPAPWTAGLADRWEQNVTYSWSALMYGQSGEQVNRKTKKRIEDWLSANLLDDDLEQSEGERVAKGVLAGVVKTSTDVALDMVVTPVLDPGTIPRGIMRIGTGSAQGMEDIEQGKTLEGSMKIVGEVSSVALMILAPVRAGGIKSIAGTSEVPGAGAASGRPLAVRAVTEPSITTSLERLNLPKTVGEVAESKTAHNVVEVGTPGALARRTHAVKDVVDNKAVAQVVEHSPKRPATPGDALKAIKEEARYDYFTRSMTAAEAQKAIAAMDSALKSNYGGLPGGIGPYAAYAEHCATHAAVVAQAGSIWTTGRLGSYTNFLLFKYMSPLGAQNLAALTAQAQVANTNYPR
jgi:hypothetical protein